MVSVLIKIYYSTTFGSDEPLAYHDPEGKGATETLVGPFYPVIGILNASGIFQIFEISYDVKIIMTSGNEIPYSAKIQFLDGRDLEIVLR